MAPTRAALRDQACGAGVGGKIAPAKPRLAMPRRTHLPSQDCGARGLLSSAIGTTRRRKGLTGEYSAGAGCICTAPAAYYAAPAAYARAGSISARASLRM